MQVFCLTLIKRKNELLVALSNENKFKERQKRDWMWKNKKIESKVKFRWTRWEMRWTRDDAKDEINKMYLKEEELFLQNFFVFKK